LVAEQVRLGVDEQQALTEGKYQQKLGRCAAGRVSFSEKSLFISLKREFDDTCLLRDQATKRKITT
jgi:hypothetical protein